MSLDPNYRAAREEFEAAKKARRTENTAESYERFLAARARLDATSRGRAELREKIAELRDQIEFRDEGDSRSGLIRVRRELVERLKVAERVTVS